jgi:dihydrodipicolinate synthase/N-acetylneuraminate lyase
MKANELKGTWGTVLLPINEDESIDFERLERDLKYLTESGLAGLYTNGTAGEFHTQTESEFLEISQLVANLCKTANFPFQIGLCHTSAQIALSRLEQTKGLEPSAFQVILPDWVTLNETEMLSFLKRMAEAAEGIGLVLYNPPHAKKALSLETIARLSEAVPNLIGIKVADGNSSWYGTLRKDLADISVFVPGHHLASGLLQGARGSYSNVACLSPKGAVYWEKLVETNPVLALAIERRIIDFFQEAIVPFAKQGYSNPALDKLLATMGGWSKVRTRLRWPHQYISQETAESLHGAARASLPELFA